jgi:hypothetical protein
VIDWKGFAERVPLGTRVRMGADTVPNPEDLILDEIDGIVMRFEDAEEGENQDFPESACEAELDFVLWVQPFDVMDEWWLNPIFSDYFIDGEWLTFHEVMRRSVR